jgi:hypothetical protein
MNGAEQLDPQPTGRDPDLGGEVVDAFGAGVAAAYVGDAADVALGDPAPVHGQDRLQPADALALELNLDRDKSRASANREIRPVTRPAQADSRAPLNGALEPRVSEHLARTLPLPSEGTSEANVASAGTRSRSTSSSASGCIGTAERSAAGGMRRFGRARSAGATRAASMASAAAGSR